MSIARRLVTSAAGILLVASVVCAQEQNAATSSRSAITITAAATADRVRFTAPSTVVQMRLEVYAANGEKLFDNEIRGGNVIDWHLQDGQAEPVSDGSYLCVITSKGLSGRMSQKLGKIAIENAAARVEPIDTAQLTAQQTQAVGPLEENASLTVLKEGETQTATIIAHNGEEGQLVRGRGALSFRIGDFFSGKDREQMRLTPEGNLGIGITHPKARLDVDGLIRTNQGIVFPDGTIQTSAATSASGGQDAVPSRDSGELFKATGQATSSVMNGKGKKNVSPELLVNEDLTINGNIIFTTAALPRDISMTQNTQAVRVFAGPTLTTSPSSAAIQFFGNGHPGFPGQAFMDSGANNAAALIFRTTGTGGTITERMRVTATGNVGIGTSGPLATLHVVSFSNSNADNTATFRAMNIGPNASHIHYGIFGNWFIRSASSSGRVILQDTGGNVGIGTTTPDQQLTVNGEADKTGGGSWATFSDERLKTIKGRFTPGLKAVMQLQPVRYEYKPDNALGLRSSGEHIGFGAQAVQKIIPEAVSENDKGYLLVNNDPILWTMLNAIKQQQRQIVELKREIRKLQDSNR